MTSSLIIPTPFVRHNLLYVGAGYSGTKPVFAIRPGASGDISLGTASSEATAAVDGHPVARRYCSGRSFWKNLASAVRSVPCLVNTHQRQTWSRSPKGGQVMKRSLFSLCIAAVLMSPIAAFAAPPAQPAADQDWVQAAIDQSLLQAQWQREQDAALQNQLLIDQQVQTQLQNDQLQADLAQQQFNNMENMINMQQAFQP
jgi:hypothetical protein